MKNNWYIHGDCVLVEIEELSKNIVWGKGNILMEGSSSGNKHTISLGKYKIGEMNNEKYLIAETEINLKHSAVDGHKDIKIPKGKYVIKNPVEMDHLADMVRKVMD